MVAEHEQTLPIDSTETEAPILDGKRPPDTQEDETGAQTPASSPRPNDWRARYLSWAWARAAIETTLIIVGLGAQWSLLPHFSPISGEDSLIRYQMLTTLFTHGHLDTSRYSIYGPIFSSPLWYLGQTTGGASGAIYWLGRYNLLLLALAVAAFYVILRDHLNHTILRTFLLLVVVASMFPNHIENYYGEVFTALTAAVGLALVVYGRGWGWASVALGVANAPATLAGLALMLARRLFQYRRLRIILVGGVVGALILGESWLRRGSPFASGYTNDHGIATFMPFSGRPGFSFPFLFGLFAILLSFGKGLLFYTPGLFLPMRRRLLALGGAAQRRLLDLYGYWLLFVVGLVLIYAKWWAWYGGWFWGPRFFLIASIPASFALAVWLHSREQSLVANLVTLAALLLAVWVGLDGAIFDQHDLAPVCLYNNFQRESLCWYTLDFSALFHPLSLYWIHGFGPVFIAREQLSSASFIYAGYVGVVLVWLAAPLVWRIARQTGLLLRSTATVYLRPTAWKF